MFYVYKTFIRFAANNNALIIQKALIMKTSLKALAFVGLTGFIAACSSIKLTEEDFKVEPSPLEVHGDEVEITITAKFPEKSMPSKAVVKATPTLVYEGGETKFDEATYQGEKFTGNNTVIPKTGKTVTYTSKVPYTPEMENSTLKLKAVGTKGSKEQLFDFDIAKGVITTPYLMQNDDMVILAEDNFERVTKHEQRAVINFDYNSSNVKSTELRDEDWKAFTAFVKATAKDTNITFLSLENIAYASPEGELDLNTDLAKERAEAGERYAKRTISAARVKTEDGFYINTPKGEDWDGFKAAMATANIDQGDKIIRILERYKDPAVREQQIQDLSDVFEKINSEIFPQLRRTQIVLKYEKQGKTDAQLMELSKSNPDTLNVEELLFAATLTEDMNEKLAIYQAAARLFPNDWRTTNNVGYILYKQGKTKEAAAQFKLAAKAEKAAVAHNNLGVIARLGGDRKAANDHYAQAAGAGQEVSYNKGLVQIQNGEYKDASANMKFHKSFNTALAQMLNGDNSTAMSTLKASGDDSAMAHYLMAIIEARNGNNSEAVGHLDKAVARDSSLAAKAKSDLEFRNIKDSFTF